MCLDIKLFPCEGFLHYNHIEGYGYKLIVNLDQSVVDFYRKLIPKYYYASPQRYNAHISVVRKEVPQDLSNWGKREGESIPFFYSNYIHHGTVYFWLNAFSKELEELRRELGLEVDRHPNCNPPDGFIKCFHISLANCKDFLK